VFTAALLGSALFQAPRSPAVLLPYAWFVLAIGPVLPLRDHFSEYYLTLPAAGLALGVGWALTLSARHGRVPLAAGAVLAILFLAPAIPISRWITEYHMQRSKGVRDLVWSVERIRELHPRKAILLHNVSSGLYWAGFADDPFRLLGLADVYLTPESAQAIPDLPDEAPDRILPAGAALHALQRAEAVVYSAASFPLRNITRTYHRTLNAAPAPGLAGFVNVGRPFFAAQLGEGWYPIEGGYRWIGRRASVRLGSQTGSSRRLHIRGYCPADLLRLGPLTLAVTVDGRRLPPLAITQPDHFDYRAHLGSIPDPVEVVVEVDRTFRQDDREAGVAFGTFSLR
jgi:hypothetical protein